MGIKRIGSFLLGRIRLRKRRKTIRVAVKEVDKRYSEIFSAWPELKGLVKKANAAIAASGKEEKLYQLTNDIARRFDAKRIWLPEEKVVEIAIYIRLRLGSIEINPEKVKLLGLENEAASIDRMLELY